MVISLGLAPATVRQVHRVFSLMLDLAVRDGRLARNPATRVPLPRAARPDKRFLTHVDVDNLARAAGIYETVIRISRSRGFDW